MITPIEYLRVFDHDSSAKPIRVRVFHGQSQTIGWLDGFTISRDGIYINLSKAITYNELALVLGPTPTAPLKSILMDGTRVIVDTHHGDETA
jgi:hypothetical protein